MKPLRFLIDSLLFPALTCMSAALALGGCATMPKGEYVGIPVGSVLTYAVRNTGSYGSGTERETLEKVERNWEGRSVDALASAQGAVLMDSNGAWLAVLAPDGQPVVSWDPPFGYPFPLEVGKTSTRDYRMMLHTQGRTIPFRVTWTVEAYEDVTVPAGTFKTFKIRQSDNLGNENVSWWNPEHGNVKTGNRRTDKSASGPGLRESELVSHTMPK